MEQTYSLALHLRLSGKWRGYLQSDAEEKLFLSASADLATWTAFWRAEEGEEEKEEDERRQEHSKLMLAYVSLELGKFNENDSLAGGPVVAAVADPLPLDQVCRFRIRSMISEQFIQTALYSSRKGHDEHRPSPPLLDLLACGSLANVSTLTTDFSLLVSLPNTKDTASTAANGNNDNNGKIDHMDEDYDDDMDASPTATLSQPQPPPAIPAVTATHIPSLHLPEHMLDPDLVPIDDVYHCLDEFVQVPLPRNELYERLNESPLTAVQQHPSTTTVLASCTNTSHHTDQQTCAGAGGGDGDLKKSFDENNGQASAINAAVAAPTTEDALNNSMSEGSPKVSSPNTGSLWGNDDREIHPNLKKLYTTIGKVADSTRLRKIKSLLVELKPCQSKWASATRIGQEKLYDALEKVLNDLRNFTEHSLPFLQKVGKKEAPDYYDIIKTPMDLGTIGKKLKNFEYNSKRDFQLDLTLIWDNCNQYNTHPESPYRKHGQCMRKKSNDLMKKVPDITIVSKALTDADSDSDDDKDTQNGDASSVQLQQQRLMRAETDSQGDAPTAIHSTTASQPPESPPAESSAANQMMGLTGSGAVPLLAKSESVESLVSRNGSDGGGAVVTFAATTTAVANNNPASIAGDLEHHDEVGGGNAGGIDNDSKIISTSNAKDGGGDAQSTPKPSKASENEVIFNQIAKLNFVIEGGSLQFRKWRDLTLKTRQQYLTFYQQQMTLPFEERPLIESNPFIFELYAESEAQYMARNWRRLNLTAEDSIPHSSTTSSSALSTNIPPSTQPHRSALSIISSSSSRDRPSSSRSRSKFEHILTLDEFYFPEWLPISLPLCITQTLAVPLANGRILNDLDLYELNDLNQSSYLPSISEYLEMQSEKSSILSLAISKNINELRKIKYTHARICAKEMKIPEDIMGIPPVPKPLSFERSPSYPPFVLNRNVADTCMRQIVAKMLAHSGFDAVHETTIGVIQDICINYFLNIGKLMRVYLDRYGGGGGANDSGSLLSNVEILMLVLNQSGVGDVSQLEYYVRTEIIRYGSKLHDLRRRLEVAYQHLLQANDENQMEEDIELDEHADQVISGSLFEELGVDLLGLREIGVDALSIPTELWNKKADKPIKARVKRKIFTIESRDATHDLDEVKIPQFKPWNVVVPEHQIGLLRPFYVKKAAADDMAEDDDKPRTKNMRSKTLLRMAQLGRKRVSPAKDTDGDVAKKKKKSSAAAAVDPAVKAAKEAEKARKAADRIEKQRLKEERKLQKGKTKKVKKEISATPST